MPTGASSATTLCSSTMEEAKIKLVDHGPHACATQVVLAPRSAAISYDSCLCGSAICTKESGLLCYLSESSCSTREEPTWKKPCTSTDATQKNEFDCSCGSSVCTARTGRICYGPESLCVHSDGYVRKNYMLFDCPESKSASDQLDELCVCASTVCPKGHYCSL